MDDKEQATPTEIFFSPNPPCTDPDIMDRFYVCSIPKSVEDGPSRVIGLWKDIYPRL